ncbi:hypothetical protein EYC84_000476 [Monilinia fructicola]|uniref:Uncharacterized protein n=1 Tax=Monilinia fructicola TaxID=38448 RepID=A0A5M9JPE6_MONFR|nr:hypothetical protein EYC84_000476 [Monilinia fructicola]
MEWESLKLGDDEKVGYTVNKPHILQTRVAPEQMEHDVTAKIHGWSTCERPPSRDFKERTPAPFVPPKDRAEKRNSFRDALPHMP